MLISISILSLRKLWLIAVSKIFDMKNVIDSSGSIPPSVAQHLKHKTWIKITYTLTGLAYMLATSYSCNDKLTMTMYLQMTDNKVPKTNYNTIHRYDTDSLTTNA